MTVKILAFDGSGRKGSTNHQLLEIVAQGVKLAGGELTLINLRDYDIPLYDGDLEASEGLPEPVMELKKIFDAHQGFLIASPEYNGTVTPLLKNTLDWVSRPTGGEGALKQFRGKVAGLMATSPGKFGGLRGLYQLNTILFGMQVMVLPEIVSIGMAYESFDDKAQLKDEKQQNQALNLGQRIVKIAQALQHSA